MQEKNVQSCVLVTLLRTINIQNNDQELTLSRPTIAQFIYFTTVFALGKLRWSVDLVHVAVD